MGRCGTSALLVGLLLTLGPTLAQAQEPGSSPEFTRLAECNRIAGKATGAKREALVAGCMERIEPAAGKSAKKLEAAAETKAKAAGAAATVGPAAKSKAAQSAAAVAGAPAAAVAAGKAVPAAALPSQTVILDCANQVAKLTGDARAKALKACLGGAQAASPAAPGAAGPPADTEQRRRANCNVLAHDKQGEARKAFIADCMAQAERRVETRATAESAPAVGGDRTARCAAEARANPGASVISAMNACLARP